MSRPIKFRFYSDIDNEMYNEFLMMELNGAWSDPAIYGCDCDSVRHYSDGHLMQFTGLSDKNGKEAYEGDIVCFTVFDYNGSDTQYKGVIKWIDTRFAIWHDNEQEYYGSDGGFDLGWVFAQDDEPEIIGNIYDNPSLLEVQP